MLYSFFSFSRGKTQSGCLLLIMENGGCFVCSFTTSLVLPQSAEFSFVLCSSPTLKVCQFPVSALSQVRQKVVPPQSRALNVHSPFLFPSQRRSRNWTFPPNCKLCLLWEHGWNFLTCFIEAVLGFELAWVLHLPN